MVSRVLDKARPLASLRFLKFGVVGVLGIAVNLGALYLFADGLGIHVNLASALAIELSILSNFLLNDGWTFADRREERSMPVRALQYHLVTGVGAVVQWLVFVTANYAWFRLVTDPEVVAAWALAHGGGWGAVLLQPLLDPPEVGVFMYGAQLVGIGAAVFWNYLANHYWTWGARAADAPPLALEPAVERNKVASPSSR